MSKAKKNTVPNKTLPMVQEPMVEYPPANRLPVIKNFNYRQFSQISGKTPFTQKEWANMLHLSERTLQRYAKNNSSFEGLYTDRILHIHQLIQRGLDTFNDAKTLYSWLKKEKQVLGQKLNFESLYTSQGIQDVMDEIGRIQYGVYI